MRILLIMPRDRTYRYGGFFKRSSTYAPLTLTTLAALVPTELDAHIRLVDEGVEPDDYESEHYDVVGISCVAASAPRAYQLAARFRRQGAFVVLGGTHPTLNPEESRLHADCVVSGFAERTWPRLLRDIAANRRPAAFYSDQPPEPFSSPPARRDLVRRGLYIPYPSVVAARGCANHCDFCSVHPFCGNRFAVRPVDEVVDEIKRLGARTFVFLDPNMGASREYTLRLLDALVPLRVRWVSAASVALAEDPEVLSLAARSGCLGLMLGFESLCQASMTHARKTSNRVADYENAVRTFHAYGMAVMGSFTFGFDDDTREIFEQTLAFVDRSRLDLARFGVLTPFPGTLLYRAFERDGRILTQDWSLYNMEHTVFQPVHMSPDELQDGLVRTWQAAYSAGRIAHRLRHARPFLLPLLSLNIAFRFYARKLAREPFGATGGPLAP